jgi:hypothetical protein
MLLRDWAGLTDGQLLEAYVRRRERRLLRPCAAPFLLYHQRRWRFHRRQLSWAVRWLGFRMRRLNTIALTWRPVRRHAERIASEFAIDGRLLQEHIERAVTKH